MAQLPVNSFNYFTDPSSFGTVWNNYVVADDRSELLAWLSPLNPSLRHRDIQERRIDNLGEWLMGTGEFRSWHDRSGECEGDNAVLFCYGNPGVGKTFISSLVVDTLRGGVGRQNTAICHFYFDFAARNEQSATNVLGALLKQILSGMALVPEEISLAFQEQKNVIGGRAPQLSNIVKMLLAVMSLTPTFICIDALDECVGLQRIELLNSLKQLLHKSHNTRIFVTGRPHVRAEIEKRLAGRVKSVSIGLRNDDVITYLRVRLEEDETPDAMDESLEAEILEKILENTSGMYVGAVLQRTPASHYPLIEINRFLLASLNIDSILQESTIYRRRERLSKMIDGFELGDAYGATIERIKAQGGDRSRLGMEALMWISYAERRLRADELCHALSIDPGSTDFNTDNVPSISTLVSCCQGLITVDEEASAVRLIHFALPKYLSAHGGIFSKSHSTIAEVCLIYLNSQNVKSLSDNPSPDIPAMPFLEYCSVYWGVHAKKELSDYARSLALELFQQYDGHISAKFLLGWAGYPHIADLDASFSFSGLHCASFFGIAEVVAALIETECYDIDGQDFGGHTPLAWAARNGHEEVVKMLLGREAVNPDRPDNGGQTPLMLAVKYGHKEVIALLQPHQAIARTAI